MYISPAYAGSHSCPSSAVVRYGEWIKLWRNAQRVSSESLAKEDTLPAFVAELLRRSRLKPWGSTGLRNCIRQVPHDFHRLQSS